MCRQWLNLTGLHERDLAAEMKCVNRDTGRGVEVLDERQRTGSLSQYLKGSLHLLPFGGAKELTSWKQHGRVLCAMKSSQASAVLIVNTRINTVFFESTLSSCSSAVKLLTIWEASNKEEELNSPLWFQELLLVEMSQTGYLGTCWSRHWFRKHWKL